MNSTQIKTGVIILILILGIIAISTKYWSTSTLATNDVFGNSVQTTGDIGLWESCVYTKGLGQTVSQCENSSESDILGGGLKHLTSVKILSISSIVLVVLSLYLLYAMPKQKQYFILSLVLAGILSIISVILWNNEPSFKNNITDLKPGYSFYLELSSGIIAILLGILTQTNIIA